MDLRSAKTDPGYTIRCGSCGNSSIVPESHGRYCPVCGPDVATPIEIKPFREDKVRVDFTVFCTGSYKTHLYVPIEDTDNDEALLEYLNDHLDEANIESDIEYIGNSDFPLTYEDLLLGHIECDRADK